MVKNNLHSVNRSYKFNLKRLGILFYQFFFLMGQTIEFVETETTHTGPQKESVVIVDDNTIHIIAFMSTPLTNKKLKEMFSYWCSIYSDPQFKGYKFLYSVVSTADPNKGINTIMINKNVIFSVNVIFLKEMDGAKILSTLFSKIIQQEELTVNEVISLLLLPDMDINIPVKALIKIIIVLFGKLNISDVKFKQDAYYCLINLIFRFYSGDEFNEMIKMLQTETRDPKMLRILKEYGRGFDEIYLNGKEDANLEVAMNFLSEGVDADIISRCTGISISQLEEIKRKF